MTPYFFNALTHKNLKHQNIQPNIYIMKRTAYLSMCYLFIIGFVACETATSQPANDLTLINAPQGTTTLIEETMIYKYSTDELKPRSTSTFTFNKDGNFLNHIQRFPEGEENKQQYSYDTNGRLLQIIAASSKYGTTTTTYTYTGENPLTITTTVENGENYIPKIIQYFEGEIKVKEEIFNNAGVLRERLEFNGDTHTSTSFTNSGSFSSKHVKTFKNGSELKSVTYNQDGSVYRGIENELDERGNMTRSWTLDKNLKRDKESFGYYYTYNNNVWVLRVGNQIRDYGSGPTANVSVRTILGKKAASISPAEIKKALKAIKI